MVCDSARFSPLATNETRCGRSSQRGIEFVFNDAENRQDGSLANVPFPSGSVGVILDRFYGGGLDEDTYTVVSEVDGANVPLIDELTDRYVKVQEASAAPRRPRFASGGPDRTRRRTSRWLLQAPSSRLRASSTPPSSSSGDVVRPVRQVDAVDESRCGNQRPRNGDRQGDIQILRLVAAYVGAVAMSVFLQQSGFVPATLDVSRIGPVSPFATPSLLTLAIAIAAGFAGAVAIATSLPMSLAGVAVAAAIVPAAAVAGIGTVWSQLILVAGAVVMLLINIVVLNITAYLMLLAPGYRSSVITGVRENHPPILTLRSGAYAAIILLFVIVAFTDLGAYKHLVFQKQVNDEFQGLLASSEYSSLDLANVAME
jgi:hypothetical protein